MEMTERVLLGLLLGVLAAFPLALFFYLRTAYRTGGWREVKTSLSIFGVALLLWMGPTLLISHIVDLGERIVLHPFAATTVVLLILSWLLHRIAMKSLRKWFVQN
jgi:hypothetical protein